MPRILSNELYKLLENNLTNRHFLKKISMPKKEMIRLLSDYNWKIISEKVLALNNFKCSDIVDLSKETLSVISDEPNYGWLDYCFNETVIRLFPEGENKDTYYRGRLFFMEVLHCIMEFDKKKMNDIKIKTKDLDLFYGQNHALKGINLEVKCNAITALIGPSGCGKSTYLKTINRMNDLIEGVMTTGETWVNGISVYDKSVDVNELRKQVGMVFQRPNPFPKSIFENVAYGLRVDGVRNKNLIEDRVVDSLQQAALWDEVKDKLKKSALALSGGQQQRLCIARALAISPSVILMDEPASALDPISTAKIEDLIFKLKEHYTILIVTHNMQQAARVSDKTAFFFMGDLVECDDTKIIFTNPKNIQTQNYITGRFG